MGKNSSVRITFRGIDKLSPTLGKITRAFPKLTKKVERAINKFRIFEARTANLRKKLSKLGGKMQSVGRSMAIGLTAPITALGVASVKAFADFEQGIVNVAKTTNLQGGAIEKLIKRITKDTPVAVAELLEIAGAAGQLGVKGAKNIENFTRTMAKLAKSSDVVGDEGAKSIARLLQITDGGVGSVNKFAAALVDLGNNAAASESEILGIASRVAQATAAFKLGSANTLGIATAMKSLGIRAESGGTVIGKTFRRMDEVLRKGGQGLIAFQKITQLSGEELKKQFGKDPTKVFEKFIQGLSRLDKKGISAAQALEAFGLKGERVMAVIPTMVGSVGLLTTNLTRANRAFKEGTALNEEFAKQAKTFNSVMTRLSNTFVFFRKEIGAQLLPIITPIIGKLSKWMKAFTNLDAGTKKIIVRLGIVVAVMGPLIFAIGSVIALMPLFILGFKFVALALLGFMGPITLTIAAVAALGAAWFVFGDSIKSAVGSAINWVMNKFRTLLNFMSSGPMRVVLNALTFGLGGFAADALKGALGPAIGGEQTAAGGKSSVQTNNASIDVNFNNPPANTSIKPSGEFDFLGITQNGLVGGTP